MLWALGFVSMFVIGGLSGIYLGAVPIDIHVSDTYFVVAHIHYVLLGGSLFTIFAGIYYWFPKMTGRMYNERLGKLHFWLTFIAFNATFFPMHWLGLQGMPRRVADYAPRFATWNLVISIASFFLGASFIVFVYNMIVSWARGPTAEANPWRALHARVAGLLAAADLQLRRDPAGGRRSVRVRRPGARHAVLNGDRAGARRATGEGRHTDMRHVLVVANETVAGETLIKALRERAGRGRSRVTVVCPINQPRHGLRRLRGHAPRLGAAAGSTRRCALLREAGIPAHGPRRRRRPRQRHPRRDRPGRSPDRRDRRLDASRGRRSGWLRRDVLDAVREGRGRRFPSSTSSSTSSSSGGEANVLVIANETVVGEPLLDRIRERAQRSPASFLIICPQSDPAVRRIRTPSGACAGRWRVLRGEGIDVHGQIAHPDPYTAAMHAVARRAGGRDPRLDVPGRGLRLAAPRPGRAAAQGHRPAGRARRTEPRS